MELPSNFVEHIAFSTGAKTEEHLLVVMDKEHEENLSKPLNTNSKQFEVAVTFPTGYNSLFNVTNKKTNFIFISLFEGA